MGDWKRLCNGPHAALTSQWVPLFIYLFFCWLGFRWVITRLRAPPSLQIASYEAGVAARRLQLSKQSFCRRYVTELPPVKGAF